MTFKCVLTMKKKKDKKTCSINTAFEKRQIQGKQSEVCWVGKENEYQWLRGCFTRVMKMS